MLSPIVERFNESCKLKGTRFAQIRTEKAIYYRVAVVEETPAIYKVVWAEGGSSSGYSLKQERIVKKAVLSIRWFND